MNRYKRFLKMRNKDIKLELKAIKKQLKLIKMELQTLTNLRKYLCLKKARNLKKKVSLPVELLQKTLWV